ncbi:helix-turn-helix domain-containing protein [Autumnicola musiva]|uniref:AraC family transcriptional regulator n=1 Tax=Autumnicola musiva TaxID=3075589 RepID=A0ABU3D1Z4_9FLAO|nr:AraC family transcriptional regulator [Zunongwangia sp. F117]MDT0675567.1 AraC family transcriptional regulator [Zunongwangia sp. F117]
MTNILYIKNMVCPRCISSVAFILDKLKLSYGVITLGEVYLEEELEEYTKKLLKEELRNSGFSLINDRKSQLIEKMKTLVVDKIHHSNEVLDIKWPEFISEKLHLDYKYLSSLFSAVESITFEQYIINQKIERIKGLVIYNELNLSEIAFQMNYSSVAYLSNQFKKVTGMTPTQFKNSTIINRRNLDDI